MSKILVVIPARGGSKGIPRKNVRLLNGQPLIAYSILNAINSSYDIDVVVSTDDEEISGIAQKYGANVSKRPLHLATDEVTLDPVIHHAVVEAEQNNKYTYDIVITMQPTSPLLTVETLNNAISYFVDGKFDTVISGVNQPHLAWTSENDIIKPLYKERLNRQYLPPYLMETGAFVITKREFITQISRLGHNLSIFETPNRESIDIDTPQDWWIAEKELNKKNVLIRVDGYAQIGLGHIYRGLLLAYNLIDHNVKFVLNEKSDLGIKKIKDSHFSYEVIKNNNDIFEIVKQFNTDIIINDILNTDENYMIKCSDLGLRVVNFEDLGEGAKFADVVVNDLYSPMNSLSNYYWGNDYYCIRDEFLLAEPAVFNDQVKEVLIVFGGTDPCDLTRKSLEAIEGLKDIKNIHFTIVLGMGYPQKEEIENRAKKSNLNITILKDVKLMSSIMYQADIAVSSQGRTMLELASMTVPTILISQNEREQMHSFGDLSNGFINLGNGKEINSETIKTSLEWLINSPQIRYQLKNQMAKTDLKSGMKRVLNLIFNKY